MNATTVEALANFFTGPAVAHNSICLGLPAPHNAMAKLFFDCREALGIRGYDQLDVAREAIKRSLS